MGYNPFDGVTPGLGPFQQYLQNPLAVALGLAWALCLVVAAYHLFPASLSFIRARRSGRPHQAEEALKDMGAPALSTFLLLLVPVIYAAIVTIAGR